MERVEPKYFVERAVCCIIGLRFTRNGNLRALIFLIFGVRFAYQISFEELNSLQANA